MAAETPWGSTTPAKQERRRLRMESAEARGWRRANPDALPFASASEVVAWLRSEDDDADA